MNRVNLSEVARVYDEAVAAGKPPRMAVARQLNLTANAASRYIGLARRAGVLAPFHLDDHRGSTLTPAQKADARTIFEGQADRGSCLICGGIHLRACPRLKRVERHADGTIIAEEYWPPGTWESEHIIFPEAAYEPDDEPGGDS